ncbi:agamous-like MADS-box protein AGL23 [Triticum dicoccoides]|uniref:agamous-like MADS-box protein AGL23 n=1 Tax=Triticum dicoccoides TaxID=85692 RepID=UPI001890466B|nr:agamous-like MADS-box protein AGL23 [Triticum dicoccoides]
MAPKQKGGNGRQKIAIRRIEKESARRLCFSKRWQGLFIKATEMVVMCGAEVAVVGFSPSGKAFSFGHPSAEAIIDRFLARGGAEVPSVANDNELKKLHLQHGELRMLLKEVKGRKECVQEAMAKERAAGDQIAMWLNPKLCDTGEKEMIAFAAKLMVLQAAILERTNQALLDEQNIHRMLQAPAPPLQPLFGGSTFEFGSSSSANTGMEMQQMHMAMPPMQEFAAGMDMHHMPMEMPPPLGLAYEMDMQQILMPTPPPSRFDAGMEMEQLWVIMSPQLEFGTEAEVQQMFMAMPPMSEFSAGMEMLPPAGIAVGVEMVQQGAGPNMGFTCGGEGDKIHTESESKSE